MTVKLKKNKFKSDKSKSTQLSRKYVMTDDWIFFMYNLKSQELNLDNYFRTAQITKPFWIHYQLIKLFLNFGQGRKSVMTLPHLVSTYPKSRTRDKLICSCSQGVLVWFSLNIQTNITDDIVKCPFFWRLKIQWIGQLLSKFWKRIIFGQFARKIQIIHDFTRW